MGTVVAKDWVFLHMPKCAGSWVSNVLGIACLKNRIGHCWCDNHLSSEKAIKLRSFILPESRPRPLIILRHPCDWYVSLYEYGHWREYQKLGKLDPDLSFPEWFYRAIEGDDSSGLVYKEQLWNDSHGYMSNHLLWLLSGVQLGALDIIKQEYASIDLGHWMLRRGFRVETIIETTHIPRINVTTTRVNRDWTRLYDRWMMQKIRELDRTAFEMYEGATWK